MESSRRWDPQALLDVFRAQILDSKTDTAASAFRGHGTGWTKVTTLALVETAKDRFRDSCTIAAKGTPTEHHRSEHLAIDVLAYDKDYGPLQFAAEHENDDSLDSICYSAWKLLQLRSPIRVLVAYFNGKLTADAPHSRTDLANAIENSGLKKHAGYAGDEIILIAADRNTKPATLEALRDLFAFHVLRFTSRDSPHPPLAP